LKNWRFPFTDYDFYAYLAIGLVILASLDCATSGGEIFSGDWRYRYVAAVVVVAYIVGHINAGIATVVVEHWLARKVLKPPIAVMMGFVTQNKIERLIGRIVGRYYEPLTKNRRDVILKESFANYWPTKA